MKLQFPFIQLPLEFDAERMAAEMNAVPESAWLPHPQGFPGNDFLPLVSANGMPKDESFSSPMRPTPYLEQSPYMTDVLASLGASLGRVRLMRLSGHAEVTPHFDIHYYWRERMRVHVPIVTQPTVRFICGDDEVNMKAGECWIFDTWKQHRVINDAERSRVHLVVDTVGGGDFWEILARGRTPNQPDAPGWAPRRVAPFGARLSDLDLEKHNVPTVMTPWEARDHINFLLAETEASQPAYQPVQRAAEQFLHTWRGLWSTFGESRDGWPRYRRALDAFVDALRAARAETLRMRNKGRFIDSLLNQVVNMALADKVQDNRSGETRDGGGVSAGAVRPQSQAVDPQFDRPVFIVSPPRSGSTLFFETLAQAPGLHTIGDESHQLIEGIPALSIAAKQGASNRLDASDATPETVRELRARFARALRDRNGVPPQDGVRVRMLEKTPKNALRIPFFASAFPEARFIYLYRDPREVLASMMEGWESGRFRTYPRLPGWEGELPWSFLLTPGWKDLARLPLNERVAAQWATTTQIMLDDLARLPSDRWVVARYDALLTDANAEIKRICAAMDLGWDRVLSAELPLSAYTVSRPHRDKWRSREGAVEAALEPVRTVVDRAAAVARS
ncbi:MAG: sulfotransferase [Hyphomonadaceae bacterium]